VSVCSGACRSYQPGMRPVRACQSSLSTRVELWAYLRALQVTCVYTHTHTHRHTHTHTHTRTHTHTPSAGPAFLTQRIITCSITLTSENRFVYANCMSACVFVRAECVTVRRPLCVCLCVKTVIGTPSWRKATPHPLPTSTLVSDSTDSPLTAKGGNHDVSATPGTTETHRRQALFVQCL
jgi:hypothetical protein